MLIENKCSLRLSPTATRLYIACRIEAGHCVGMWGECNGLS